MLPPPGLRVGEPCPPRFRRLWSRLAPHIPSWVGPIIYCVCCAYAWEGNRKMALENGLESAADADTGFPEGGGGGGKDIHKPIHPPKNWKASPLDPPLSCALILTLNYVGFTQIYLWSSCDARLHVLNSGVFLFVPCSFNCDTWLWTWWPQNYSVVDLYSGGCRHTLHKTQRTRLSNDKTDNIRVLKLKVWVKTQSYWPGD